MREQVLLEIEAEDVGGTSLMASLLITLSSQCGNACFRFVGRVRGGDPDDPDRPADVVGATCPATRPTLDDMAAQGEWLETQRERFHELHRHVLEEGWRPVGRGDHWWSGIYRRA